MRLKSRPIHLFNVATARALMHLSMRRSFEPDALVASAALSGLSLVEKFRSAVRKKRS